ncbi:hypothetical protein GCM10010965_17840 [Caldalkalibacillus thermarum]|uniref:DNA-directed RNA polymerase subunit beta n=1 Tax=Caldalkalibacillus thermarum TaxID=296745 RepID=UPI00166D9D64|nr:DNA-directed RNA polymerase subunit beta [Caldalkalibacillus thermarum]GGK25578.1 hypothetical protein GCM10010965_17840 [Caldalkalibacillus thermarum]
MGTQQEERQQLEKEKKQGKEKKKKIMLVRKRPLRQRILLFMAKWLFIFFCFFATLVAGLIVGFGVLGKEDLRLVINIETWKHIYNLVFKD